MALDPNQCPECETYWERCPCCETSFCTDCGMTEAEAESRFAGDDDE